MTCARLAVAALAATLLCAAQRPGEPPPVLWKHADRHIGRLVTISGRIVASFKHRGYCMLHFHKDHQKYLTVIIRKKQLKRFPEAPEDYYLDKDVLVRGRVRLRGRQPVIYLTEREQIWIVGEALQSK